MWLSPPAGHLPEVGPNHRGLLLTWSGASLWPRTAGGRRATCPQLSGNILQEREACHLCSDHASQDSWKGLAFVFTAPVLQRALSNERASESLCFSHLNGGRKKGNSPGRNGLQLGRVGKNIPDGWGRLEQRPGGRSVWAAGGAHGLAGSHWKSGPIPGNVHSSKGGSLELKIRHAGLSTQRGAGGPCPCTDLGGLRPWQTAAESQHLTHRD